MNFRKQNIPSFLSTQIHPKVQKKTQKKIIGGSKVQVSELPTIESWEWLEKDKQT